MTEKTAAEFRAMLGHIATHAVDRLAATADLNTLNIVAIMYHRSPLAAASMRTSCLEVFRATLDQPQVRAEVRALAAHPKRAKRFRRMLDLVQQEQPAVFAEATTTPVDERFISDFDKSWSGRAIRFRVVNVEGSSATRTRARARGPQERTVAQIRADVADDFRACVPRVQAIANDPAAKPSDRRKAAALLKRYGITTTTGAESPNQRSSDV